MSTTPVTLLSLRSGNTADRPVPTTAQVGELAINFAAAENGLYFKDSLGAIRKVTGCHYGTTAPNSSPAGQTGNSTGETWVNSSTSAYYMNVWTGSAWQKVGAGFADSATLANSAATASSADEADAIRVVTSLPAASTGDIVYLNSGASGIYVSANGGWVPAA